MSNVLTKDRVPIKDDLKVLSKIELLAKETSDIVHDANKIPNRKKDSIAKRIMDHCINAYEFTRTANIIRAENSKDQARREQCAFKAECELGCLLSDIHLISHLITGKQAVCENQWYKAWSMHAYQAYEITSKWRHYEETKLEEIKAKERKEQEKLKEEKILKKKQQEQERREKRETKKEQKKDQNNQTVETTNVVKEIVKIETTSNMSNNNEQTNKTIVKPFVISTNKVAIKPFTIVS